MLTSQGRLSREAAIELRNWHHSGFQVYCGRAVDCGDQKALERLTAYILRPSFAGRRLQYDPMRDPLTIGRPRASYDPWMRWTGSPWSSPTFPIRTNRSSVTTAEADPVFLDTELG